MSYTSSRKLLHEARVALADSWACIQRARHAVAQTRASISRSLDPVGDAIDKMRTLDRDNAITERLRMRHDDRSRSNAG